MSDPKITIIGGGLSAIYAYWGCLDAGYSKQDVEVLYTTRNMPVGAIFMYESPIPWQYTEVTSILLGTCDGYSLNQWGEARKTSAHFRFKNGDYPVVTEQLYMLDEMLVTLWGMIPLKGEIEFFTEEQVNDLKKRRKAVICTFPNKYRKQEFKERGFIGAIPIHSNSIISDKHIVLYNGEKDIPWIRQTIIPGKIFTEYQELADVNAILDYESRRGNAAGKISLVPEIHPASPGIDWEERIEDNIFRVGRMSCFTPGYLSHQARRETTQFLRKI